MKKSPESKAFWRLFTPLLAYWLVNLVFDFLEVCVMMIVRAEEIAPLMAQNLQALSEEELMEVSMQLGKIMQEFSLQYQTECTIALAFCMIPVMGMMFLNDRRRELREQAAAVNVVSPGNMAASGNTTAPESTATSGGAAQPENVVQPGSYALIIGLGMAFCLVGNCLAGLSGLAYSDQAYQETAAAFYGAPFVLLLVGSGLLVPLAEELFYRGLIFKRFRGQGSFWVAAAVSTLLFSGGHGNLVQSIYTIGLGILLAYVYERYGALKAPVVLHATANIMSVCCTQFGVFDWLMANRGWMAALAVVGTFVGMVLFMRLWQSGNHAEETEETEEE